MEVSERAAAAAGESAPVGEVGSAPVEEENGLVAAVETNVQAVAGNVPAAVVNEREEEEEIEQAVAVSILVEETLEKAVDAASAWEGMVLKLEASDPTTAMALHIWICRNRQACSPREHKP